MKRFKPQVIYLSVICTFYVSFGRLLDVKATSVTHPQSVATAQEGSPSLSRYLQLIDRSPHLFEPQGDTRRDEIQIVLDADEIRAIEKATFERLQKNHSTQEAFAASRVGVIMEDSFWLVLRDAVRFPNGTSGVYNRRVGVIRKDGGSPGACAIPQLPDGRLVLVTEFRHQERAWRLGLPQGFREPGEDDQSTIAREVLEETGYVCADLKKQPDVYIEGEPVPFFSCGVTQTAPQRRPDDGEALGPVVLITKEELRDAIVRGSYEDKSGRRYILHHTLATALTIMDHGNVKTTTG